MYDASQVAGSDWRSSTTPRKAFGGRVGDVSVGNVRRFRNHDGAIFEILLDLRLQGSHALSKCFGRMNPKLSGAQPTSQRAPRL